MKSYLAQGGGTYSKLKRNYAYNVPSTIESGCEIGINSDNKLWNDWSCGLGSNLKGWHNNYSLNCKLAEPVAEKLCNRFGYDKVKILQSGSAACDAAVRIARSYKKGDVMWSGYHGCGNTFICKESPGLGTEFERSHKYNDDYDLVDILKIKCLSKGVSCVIIEPVRLDYSPKRIKQLKEIRELTKKLGILLIFDEIITGFRFLKGSVSNATGIKPDLLCLGKGLGNGYPISAVLGSEKLMEQDYFISNTHNAFEPALKEALFTLARFDDIRIKRMWDRGSEHLKKTNAILSKLKKSSIKLVGYPTRSEWQTEDLDTLTALWELMATKRHICGRAFFLNLYHTSDITDKFLVDLSDSVSVINKGYKRKGRCVSFSFKRN